MVGTGEVWLGLEAVEMKLADEVVGDTSPQVPYCRLAGMIPLGDYGVKLDCLRRLVMVIQVYRTYDYGGYQSPAERVLPWTLEGCGASDAEAVSSR